MSALFDLPSFLTVLLLSVTTCTFVKLRAPSLLATTTGIRGLLWKLARIGERLSPWVALSCISMGIYGTFF